MAALILSAPSADRGLNLAKWGALALLVIAAISMRGEVFWRKDALDRGILVYARSFDERPELKVSEQYQDTDVVYFATVTTRQSP
jgi:hypothetical protein